MWQSSVANPSHMERTLVVGAILTCTEGFWRDVDVFIILMLFQPRCISRE